MNNSAKHTASTHSGINPVACKVYSLTVCQVDNQEFGIPSEFIQETLSPHSYPMDANAQGDSPAGTFDLRGLQLPIFYLSQLLNLPLIDFQGKRKLLVCRMMGFRAGLLVDAICETISIPGTFIVPAHGCSQYQNNNAILWVAQLDREYRLVPIVEMGYLSDRLQHLMIPASSRRNT